MSKLHMMKLSFLTSLTLLTSLAFGSDHPGNVFVAGEDVRVPIPAAWQDWHCTDFDGKEVAHGGGGGSGAVADLGKLPVGYFELRPASGPGRVTAGVVEKITAEENTPIALDAAVAWFYQDPAQIRDACTLCRLAGVRWVRDRGSWPEIETARGVWAPDGRYERAMRIEHEAGLKVLQVNHISPPWAAKDPKHFPDDLRDVFNFYRGLAQRWKGLADAIEPWNEPDIDMFGGHTGCEIASFEKAAYLGLKAGNPDLPVNAAVFAIDRPETLDDYGANDVFPYFDRYDLHHYKGLKAYPTLYARHRAQSAGRPMWTTEFNLTIHWADPNTHEPSDDQLRVQAYRVAKVFSEALHEGTQKAFYFILGDYVERNLQYGLIHGDLTPRPAYLAFAAVGRLLDGAKPIGRVDLGNDKLFAYAFRTVIEGAPQETLVAWSETKPSPMAVPPAGRVYDCLGRPASANSGNVELTRSPVFVVLPPNGSKALKVTPPPAKAEWREGKACPLVLQLVGKGDAARSAFLLDETKQLRLVAYNFGDKPARGTISVEGAEGGTGEVEIEPGGRVERTIRVEQPGRVTARLELGDDAGRAIVSGNVATVAPATAGN